MKPAIRKSVSFISRSMLWSLLFYVVLMLVFNWNEVLNTVKGNNVVTIATSSQAMPAAEAPSRPANITTGHNVAGTIVTLLRTITVFSQASN